MFDPVRHPTPSPNTSSAIIIWGTEKSLMKDRPTSPAAMRTVPMKIHGLYPILSTVIPATVEVMPSPMIMHSMNSPSTMGLNPSTSCRTMDVNSSSAIIEKPMRSMFLDDPVFEIIFSIPGFGILSAAYVACMGDDFSRFRTGACMPHR